MLCRIADLIVDVPVAGGLDSRCEAYRVEGSVEPEIVIREELYRRERYPAVAENTVAYMESAYQFYKELVRFGGFYLHASAVVLDGKAYLFSGFPGAGKSTHTQNWQAEFGTQAVIINDDKPALRRIDGKWYAYGTPWCGKDGINQNQKAPVAGVCFLVKAEHNAIRRLSVWEATQRVMGQTIHKFQSADNLDQMLSHLERFLQEIPVYEMENLPDAEAVRLSHSTM
ncbi:MAG: hypothetical protein J6Q54_04025, partial [Oscillospiraceae bacterium]|nr:hypothetical protein [Oscillospiraceae bacterium]